MRSKFDKKYIIFGVVFIFMICLVYLFNINYKLSITKIDDNNNSIEVKENKINYNNKLKDNLNQISSYLEQENFEKQLDKLTISLCNTNISDTNCLINSSVNIYDGILSLSVNYTNPESEAIDTNNVYNFNVKTSEILSNTELLNKFNISEKDFIKKLQNTYIDFFKQDNKKYIEYLNNDDNDIDDETKILSFDRLEKIEKNIKNNTFSADDYFIYINDDNKLELIINNKMWIETRPQVSWREALAYATEKVVLN